MDFFTGLFFIGLALGVVLGVLLDETLRGHPPF